MNNEKLRIATLLADRRLLQTPRSVAETIKTVNQPFPEALFADDIFELDVSQMDEESFTNLWTKLVHNGMAVQRIFADPNRVSHLQIWPLEPVSACSQQRKLFMEQLQTFRFGNGLKWRSADFRTRCNLSYPRRDFIFALPRRLPDECTWVAGAHLEYEDGREVFWNRATMTVKFANRYCLDIAEIAVYIPSPHGGVLKMTPESKWVAADNPPAVLF